MMIGFCSISDSGVSLEHFKNQIAIGMKFNSRNFIDSWIAGETILCKIDLKEDKTEILRNLNDMITTAQDTINKLEGTNKLKRAKTSLQENLIENIFIQYFIEKKYSLTRALEETENELLNSEIKIDVESIKRRYIPAIKKRYGIKDIRELRNKINRGSTE